MSLRYLQTSERRLELTSTQASPDVDLEPIDLETVKKVLRFTSTSEDGLIEGWIQAARQYFEDQTSRATIAAAWSLTLDAFPVDGVIELPHPPLLEVSGVGYVDGDGADQAVDADTYTVLKPSVGASPPLVTDPFCARGRIVLNDGASWPTPIDRADAITVTFWAGYGYTQAQIPEIVKATLYDLVRHFFARPDGDLPMTTQVMLRMFRQSAITQVAMERTWLV